MSGTPTRVGLTKLVIFVCPVFFVLFCMYVKATDPIGYKNMLEEDAVVENLTCIAFLLGSVFALLMARRFFQSRRRFYGCMYVLACLFMFFVGMEEISWGQRIFQVTTPEYLIERNEQEETNVHNLYGLHQLMSGAYYLIGLVGACGWMVLRLSGLKSLRDKAKYFVPDWYLSLYFFLSFFIAFYLKIATSMGWLGFFDWRDTEVGEMLMAFGFCLFVAAARRRQLAPAQGERPAVEEQAFLEAGAGLPAAAGATICWQRDKPLERVPKDRGQCGGNEDEVPLCSVPKAATERQR